MKTILRVASVLTWFNIIVWGMIVAFGLLGVLLLGQLPYVGGFVLLSAIPLNCYAALKLHTSVRYPNVPLSHQTRQEWRPSATPGQYAENRSFRALDLYPGLAARGSQKGPALLSSGGGRTV